MPAAARSRVAAAQAAVVAAAAPRAGARGWTRAVLDAAVAETGIDAPLAARAFPRGPADLVDAFHAEADRAMEEAFAARPTAALGIGARIALIVRLRLDAMSAHREAVRKAVAFHALPPYAADGARCLARTADRMWRAVGDVSTDFSFYTRRATLCWVLATTTLAWLDNPGGREAEAFLARRLAGVRRLGAARARAEAAAGGVRRAVASLRRGFPAGRPGGRGSRPAPAPPPGR